MRLRRRSQKSPILDATTVDYIALSPDGTTYALVMTETRSWNGGEDQSRDVQTKLNHYMAYILDGQMDADLRRRRRRSRNTASA